MEVTDLGPTQLKNIERSIRVYSLQVGVPAKAKPATEAKPHPPKRGSALALLALGYALLLVLVAAGAWYFLGTNRTAPIASNAPPPLAAQRLSVVVLPFANLSGDPGQDYLVDALTDELTTALARIRDSFVIARNTAFTYKGKPIDAKGDRQGSGRALCSRRFGATERQSGQGQRPAHRRRQRRASLGRSIRHSARRSAADAGRDRHPSGARDGCVQLPEAEAARLKRTPAANPDAEGLALQCDAAVQKGGYLGKEADAGYRLCEQALAADPNNARALAWLSAKFVYLVNFGRSADREGDLKRGDELVSQALALDPNYARAHSFRGGILRGEGRLDEAIAEHERALALDPALVTGDAGLGFDYLYLGQFEKSIEYLDKAIRLSPHDPTLALWYEQKAADHFGLKQYNQTIESARWAIAINPNTSASPHLTLIAALALTGHEAEAHETLQNYLASVPSGPKTIAAWKAFGYPILPKTGSPRYLETLDRYYDGLRKAGMPEE
jgi:tetratricopeptide (TPR) repeat protein